MKIQLSRTVGAIEQHRIIPTGYSWTTALFGPIPSAVRRLYLHALAIAVASFFSYGLVGPVIAFFINKFHIKTLLAGGWRIADEEQRRFVEGKLKLSTNPPPADPTNNQAEALWKSLKESVAPSGATVGPTGLPKTGLIQNRPFVIAFTAINFALVLSAVWILGGLSIWLPVLGFGGALVSLVFAKALAIRAHGMKVIDPAQPGSDGALSLYAMVAELSKRAGLPEIPEVGIYESPDVNAFATGMNRSNALVAFSSGLLEKMPVDQIRAVAAHEIAHIANQDMLGMVLLQGVINSIVILFSLPFHFLRLFNFGEGYSAVIDFCLWLFQILLTLLLMFLGSLVMKAFSRSREYRADAFAADLLGKESMVGALKTISLDTAEIPIPQRAYAAFKVSGRISISEFFSTHPLTEKRIQALEQATYMTRPALSVAPVQPVDVALPPASE